MIEISDNEIPFTVNDKKIRQTYNINSKKYALEMIEKYKGVKSSVVTVAGIFNIDPRLLSKWILKSNEIQDEPNGTKRKLRPGRAP